jgi:hypothetical protein
MLREPGRVKTAHGEMVRFLRPCVSNQLKEIRRAFKSSAVPNDAERKNGRALAGSRRRARKQRRMPVSDDGARLKGRGWSPHLDEKYDCRGRRYRSHSMHCDAQRAMV